ncbi:triacylglycerol lipase [Acinetobacter sp. Marseille-Q1618]|uniref:esterase/lipase family protein n=1 Tax=Acinetobacter sp. Marseille-Q1618 TaxID=2697502 RepID=UPI00156E70C5|nr:alpha/beta fold hydrolase [Acinetobacter sp. Marseille-Q1618]
MLMQHSKKNILLILAAMTPLLLNGCQVVSVKSQKVNVTIANERDSILTRNKISEASLNVLSMTGSEAKKCTEQPDQCIQDLEKIPQIQDEQLLSTASEVYLAKAIALSNSSSCKISIISKHQSEEKQKLNQTTYDDCLDQQLAMLDKSIRYSYAYLFKTERQPQDRIFDNRQVQIRDFYNQALAKMITSYGLRHKGNKTVPKDIKIGKSIYSIDYSHYPQLNTEEVENLLSSYNLNFSGLRSLNRRDGFGAEFVAILTAPKKAEEDKYIVDPVHHHYQGGVNPNIHDPRYLAVSITAQPKTGESVDEILHNPNFSLKIYDPYSIEKIQVAKKEYPLAANFSAPYGLWLAENNLGAAAYLTLIDRDQRLTMPHLYMLEPFNPNKKVIVLVHGLASSPEAWIRLTNDIMGDHVLREHYQVWQVFYSTNMPILESRYQINAIINQTFNYIGQDTPAAKDAVLVGHSMGGIISRLLVSDINLTQPAFKLLKNRQLNRFKDDPIFSARLNMQPINNFDRAIFLSSPHRGTEFADRWFTLAARKIIKLPGAFLGALADTIQDQDLSVQNFLKDVGNGLIQNGPSDLSNNSKFTQLTENVMPKKGMVYHSIIGNSTNSEDPDVMSDGIVPYKSAHLDGAASEIIIKGGHSIQETPQAVLELRRILRLHLAQLGIYKP